MTPQPSTLSIAFEQIDHLEKKLDREIERLDDLCAFFKMMEDQADKASQGEEDGGAARVWQGQRALYSYLSRFMLNVAYTVRDVDAQLLEHLVAHENTP